MFVAGEKGRVYLKSVAPDHTPVEDAHPRTCRQHKLDFIEEKKRSNKKLSEKGRGESWICKELGEGVTMIKRYATKSQRANKIFLKINLIT